MNNALGVIAFVVTVLVMVLWHEVGHYFWARRFGIKVEEFFIGFGPRLFGWRRGETDFGVKAILLGGYVKIAGMNPWQTIPEDELPQTFGAKPSWQRAVVLLAGSFNHFILATLVFIVMYGVVGIQDPAKITTTVETVEVLVDDKVGPAKKAGLRAGDQVVSVDGVAVDSWAEIRSQIRGNANSAMEFGVLRDGQRKSLTVTPVEAEVRTDPEDPSKTERVGQIGVLPRFGVTREPPHKAVWLGVKTTGLAIGQSVVGIGQIFSPDGISKVFKGLGQQGARSSDQPFGLVGAGRIAGEVASAGQIESLVLFLTGFIIFVGVINLAPLPPLDGGHLLVIAIEKVTGRKVDMKKVVPVAGLVIGFFLVLTVALLYLDIVRPVQNPLQ